MQATSDRENPKRDSKYAKNTTAANRISCGLLRQQQGRMTLHRQSGAEGTYTPTAPAGEQQRRGSGSLSARFSENTDSSFLAGIFRSAGKAVLKLSGLWGTPASGAFLFLCPACDFYGAYMRRSPFIQGEHRKKACSPAPDRNFRSSGGSGFCVYKYCLPVNIPVARPKCL